MNSRPGGLVVPLPVTAVEGGLIDDGAFPGTAGQGIVHDFPLNSTALHVLDLIPLRPGEAHAWQALAKVKTMRPFWS